MNEKQNMQYQGKDLNGLLEVVGKKLGMQPDQLRQELQAGKFDNAMKNMNASDAAKFRQAVNNPQMVEKLMSSPQARALYQKLTGGK